MIQNEVDYWEITWNGVPVGGKQQMPVRQSNETLWCTMMELESVLCLFLTVHPNQFTQMIGQLVLM